MDQPSPVVPTVAYLPDGSPVYVDPGLLRSHQQQPAPAPALQPRVVHHHHYAPQQARRGPDVRQVLAWTAVGGIGTAALLAVAATDIALGLAALAMAVLALVIRQLWRDLRGRR